METNINEIEVNGVKYIRKDSINNQEPGIEEEGLKYAIVRSRNQGVMSGFIKEVNGQTVILKKARQIYRYDSSFVLPDMAEFGVRNPDNCKFSTEMSQDMVMTEACGIIYCTKTGMESIRNVKTINLK